MPLMFNDRLLMKRNDKVPSCIFDSAAWMKYQNKHFHIRLARICLQGTHLVRQSNELVK